MNLWVSHNKGNKIKVEECGVELSHEFFRPRKKKYLLIHAVNTLLIHNSVSEIITCDAKPRIPILFGEFNVTKHRRGRTFRFYRRRTQHLLPFSWTELSQWKFPWEKLWKLRSIQWAFLHSYSYSCTQTAIQKVPPLPRRCPGKDLSRLIFVPPLLRGIFPVRVGVGSGAVSGPLDYSTPTTVGLVRGKRPGEESTPFSRTTLRTTMHDEGFVTLWDCAGTVGSCERFWFITEPRPENLPPEKKKQNSNDVRRGKSFVWGRLRFEVSNASLV